MKKLAIIIGLITMTMSLAFGQTKTDSISMKKVFGGYQFYQGPESLSVKQLVKTMESNPEAYGLMKDAQSTYTLASVFGIAGGFLVGWPIGTAIGGGEPNWTLAGIGAGLIIVSIPISKKFNKQARQAVKSFNSNLEVSSLRKTNEWRLAMTDDGIGLVFKF